MEIGKLPRWDINSKLGTANLSLTNFGLKSMIMNKSCSKSALSLVGFALMNKLEISLIMDSFSQLVLNVNLDISLQNLPGCKLQKLAVMCKL